MKCASCGDELSEVKRVVESPNSPASNLVVVGFASVKTGKQSCSRGGPHTRPRPEKMSSEDIWRAIDNERGSHGV